jgi:hypothetical protein
LDVKINRICALYREAPALTEQGERVMSSDELSGVQALERKHPGLPMVPGKVERVEFEYIRHGTCSFIFSRDVVSGQVLAPSDTTTRECQILCVNDCAITKGTAARTG